MSFFELFQPGLKHLREEKERQKMLVSKPTHGGGAPLGIDLDAGTAKITIAPKADRSSRTGVGGPDDLGRQSGDIQSDTADQLDADHEANRVTDSVTGQQ
jgi:hypothetical protein